MNLQINLLRPEEKRSASLLSLRFILRLAAVLAPTLLLLWLISRIMTAVGAQRSLRDLQAQWSNEEPQLTAAREARDDMRFFIDLDAELDGWQSSRMDWHTVLPRIQALVPPTIQLRQLTISHELRTQADGAIAREFALNLGGKATGPAAEADIERFSEALRACDFIARLDPAQADRDSSANAHADDRIFTIKGAFQPRRLR